MPSIDWSLYAITPDDVETGLMLEMVAEALESGITVLQVRRKKASAEDLLGQTERILEMARERGIPVLVNDQLDVAISAGADGAHLGQEDLSLEEARTIAPEGMVIGVSVHDPQEARAAEEQKADYVAVGPVYSTPSKVTGPPGGVDLVRSIRRAAAGPVIAIGGIGPENVREVLDAGADGVAVISAIFGGPSVRARVGEFKQAIEDARRTSYE
jgi:thiamine-phosphate pyrophosphorylase